MTGWIDSARAALPRREDAIITGIFFSFIRHRFCGKNGWGVSSLIRWRERRNKMREGGREGGKRKRIEKRNERNVFPIFSSFFFFFLSAKIRRRKIFLNTRKAGNSSVPTSFSREMKLPLVGQREQPGGKLDRFVAGECKFLHLISCIFFLFLFFSPSFSSLLNCSFFFFFSIDNFFLNRLFFTKALRLSSSIVIQIELNNSYYLFYLLLCSYRKEAKLGKIVSICKIKKRKKKKESVKRWSVEILSVLFQETKVQHKLPRHLARILVMRAIHNIL